MPGRRKSSTPCMVQVLGPSDPKEALHVEMFDMAVISEDGPMDGSEPRESADSSQVGDVADQEDLQPETLGGKPSDEQDEQEKEVSQSDREAQKKGSKAFECKCCPFSCPNLEDFKDHVDSSHPDVILNPLYRCAVCDFNTKKFDLLTEHNKSLHPDENNFKFERIRKNDQTVLEQTIELQGRLDPEERPASDAHCLYTGVKSPNSGGRVPNRTDPIAALNINGTVIIPEPSVLQDPSHVAPVLQRPPNYNCQPQVAVPLNSTKYNPSLDRNLTLITSFNKFPYPTHAELSWLTAASKHPEEQIKVWFTTQRLKQGITWSPEEVEEARKKMFNGSIPALHHTFTTPSAAAFQQGPVERQRPTSGSLPSFAKNLPAGVPLSSGHTLKRSQMAPCGPESKRPVMAVAPCQGGPKDKGLMAPFQKEHHLPGAVPPFTMETKKSPVVVPLMTASSTSLCAKGKLLPLSGNPKTKPVVSLPSIIFPESLTRPTIAPPPIFAPSFKSSLLVPRFSKSKLPSTLPAANVAFPNTPSLVTSPVRRPPIIQSTHTLAKVPRPEQSSAEGDCGLRGDVGPRCSSDVPALAHDDGARGGEPPLTDSQQRSSVLTHFPLLERMKGKTAEQLKILEEQFLRNSFLSHGDVDNLALGTGLSHREIDGWFAERRALRDNLELALLNSMGTKRTEAEKDASLPLNGVHKLTFAAEDRKRGSVPLPRPVSNFHSAPPLKDHFAQPEATAPSEVWPGLAGVDLARWFCDSRSTLHADFFQNGGLNAGAGLPQKASPSSSAERGREGGAEVLESELGRLMEQRANGLSAPQHGELQERLAGRCE